MVILLVFITQDTLRLKPSTIFILRGAVMNNKIKSEKFRALSVTALVTGILAVSLAIVIFIVIFFELVNDLIVQIFVFGYSPATGLAIAAIVCGAIDLKRIKAGHYSKKGRGFDIAGIVLGGIFILFMLPVWFL